MEGRGSGIPVGDSSCGDELGDGGMRFPGLSDSFELRRLQVSELSDSLVLGGRRQSEATGSGVGLDEGSPKMVVDAVMDGQVSPLVAGGVAGVRLDGATIPVHIGGYASVDVDPSSRRVSALCPMPASGLAHSVSSSVTEPCSR
ncbi:hypothetical protein Dimus_008631 [Dionaea muscipula]